MSRKALAIVCLSAGLIPGFGHAAIGERTPDFAGVIVDNARILALPETEAAREVPVRLRGVVLGEAPPIGRGFVLWDGHASIYVRDESPAPGSCKRGHQIELEGVTNAGGFTPSVTMTAVRHLGEGTLPAPRTVSADELVAGRHDAEWVSLRGIVRSCEASTVWAGRWRLVLASGGQLFTVHCNHALAPPGLVDAEVTVDGLVFNQHNMSRQSVRPLLFIPEAVPIRIEVAAPTDPFAAPVRPVARLLQFEPTNRHGHRVHVRGTVVHQQPGNALWIREGERGLCALSDQSGVLQTGDLVDVLGFPTPGAYTPRLEDSVFRKVSAGAAPRPCEPPDMRAATAHDSDLVAIEGDILGTHRTASSILLALDWQGIRIPASLPLPAEMAPPAHWLPGSRIRATGICRVPDTEPGRASGTWDPSTFELLLRSTDDVHVLRPAPWWTPQRIVRALAFATGALLLATGGIVWFARRRIQEQSIRRARAEAEFTAILGERNRMAREIHDTLAQGLAAISMRLELAKSTEADPPTGNNIAEAHRLAKETLAEARASIWNMRSQLLESRGLAGAIEAVLNQLGAGTKTQSTFSIAGQPRPLAPVVESELLRIAQEAISNALQHASPRTVAVALSFAKRSVELAVTDDGCGFDPEKSMAAPGHFGLVGIRERTAQIGGRLTLTSERGKGTQLKVTVPLPPE